MCFLPGPRRDLGSEGVRTFEGRGRVGGCSSCSRIIFWKTNRQRHEKRWCPAGPRQYTDEKRWCPGGGRGEKTNYANQQGTGALREPQTIGEAPSETSTSIHMGPKAEAGSSVRRRSYSADGGCGCFVWSGARKAAERHNRRRAAARGRGGPPGAPQDTGAWVGQDANGNVCCDSHRPGCARDTAQGTGTG